MEKKRGNTVGFVRRLILNDINSGAFKDWPKLTTENLAQKYSVSRTPVREALTQLSKEGMVEIIANAGFQLRQMSLTEICEIYEIREQLEGLAANKVAAIGDKAVIKKLRALCDKLEDSSEFEEWQSADRAFHQLICDSCGSKTLKDMIGNFLILSTIFAVVPNISEKYEKVTDANVANEHTLIVDAIAEGNSKSAEKYLKNHIASARKRIQKMIKKMNKEGI